MLLWKIIEKMDHVNVDPMTNATDHQADQAKRIDMSAIKAKINRQIPESELEVREHGSENLLNPLPHFQ